MCSPMRLTRPGARIDGATWRHGCATPSIAVIHACHAGHLVGARPKCRLSGGRPDGSIGTKIESTEERNMATDGHDEISKEQREFSRRRFLRRAGVAAAAHTALRRPDRDPDRAGSERGDLQAQQRQRDLRQPPEVQVRDGQSRDDELVLHGDDLRDPGCMRPDRLLVSVDRLGELCRLPDGRGLQHRDRREGERHRVLSHRQHRLQQARRLGAEPRHPRDRVQRRRLGWGPRTTGRPTSARTT